MYVNHEAMDESYPIESHDPRNELWSLTSLIAQCVVSVRKDVPDRAEAQALAEQVTVHPEKSSC